MRYTGNVQRNKGERRNREGCVPRADRVGKSRQPRKERHETMAPEERLYIAFDSTHAAMASQKLLAALRPAVIPTPCQISASCGMTLLLAAVHEEEARRLLAGAPDVRACCAFNDAAFQAID